MNRAKLSLSSITMVCLPQSLYGTTRDHCNSWSRSFIISSRLHFTCLPRNLEIKSDFVTLRRCTSRFSSHGTITMILLATRWSLITCMTKRAEASFRCNLKGWLSHRSLIVQTSEALPSFIASELKKISRPINGRIPKSFRKTENCGHGTLSAWVHSTSAC